MNKSQLSAKFAEMCNHGLDQFPSSLTLTLVRNAVAVVSTAIPGWFIEHVGPFFWEKREEIKSANLKFFLERSWEEQYASWGFMGSTLAPKWESTIKEGVKHLHETNPEALHTIPKSLVAMYARYLQICQSETA